jgi:hypothetical protein
MSKKSLSRRTMLAGIPAAMAMPTAAAASPDPVFAAIAAHEGAYDELEVLCNVSSDEIGGRERDRPMDETMQRSDKALAALLNTMPTTIEGVGRVLQWSGRFTRAGCARSHR